MYITILLEKDAGFSIWQYGYGMVNIWLLKWPEDIYMASLGYLETENYGLFFY